MRKHWILIVCMLIAFGCTGKSGEEAAPADFLKEVPQDAAFVLEIPSHLDAKFESESVTVSIDAAVTAAQTTQFQIDRITYEPLSVERYLEILNVVAPDVQWRTAEGETVSSEQAVRSVIVYLNTDDDQFLYLNTPANQLCWFRRANGVLMPESGCEEPEDYAMFADAAFPDPDAAREQAIRTIEQAGFGSEFSVASEERGIVLKQEEPTESGWIFRFARQSGQLPGISIVGYTIWRNTGYPKLCGPWKQETIQVFVTEDGTTNFSYANIGTFQQTVFRDVKLLPFDTIIKNMADRLILQHERTNDGYGPFKTEAHVVSMQLCNALVAEARGKTGYTIPAWEIRYDLIDLDAYGQETDRFTEALYLSALTGEAIEPRCIHEDEGNK